MRAHEKMEIDYEKEYEEYKKWAIKDGPKSSFSNAFNYAFEAWLARAKLERVNNE